MIKQKYTIWLVIIVNIVFLLFIRFLWVTNLNLVIDFVIFTFIVIPLLIVSLNCILALKFKLHFYQYALAAYIGYFVYSFVKYYTVLIINKPEVLPPGETVLGADLILILFLVPIETIWILIVGGFVYLSYRVILKIKSTKSK